MEETVNVGLVEIGAKFGEEYYFPYTIGVLQAYAQKNLKNPKDFVFKLPLYKPTKLDQAVDCLSETDIIFFSTYIWNTRKHLEIAKRIKDYKKEHVIVFGGPNVPEKKEAMEAFLKKYPFIDIASHDEGEIPFLEILENFKERTWQNVSSIGFFNRENFVYNPVSSKKVGEHDYFSPYLDGIFPALMRDNPYEKWSGLIETNRECPYSCTFCYWGKGNQKKIGLFDINRVYGEIDWFSQNKIEFVFCCDANFGLLKRDFDIVKRVSENKKEYGYPMAFSVQNTKNATEKIFAIQKELNDSGLQKGVNLAFQSMNEETLESIKRKNISNETYKKLQLMFTKDKVPTFSDLILGLPDETYDTFTNGVSHLIESGQHNRLQFINLMVLENTEMAEPAYIEKYGFRIVESKLVSHHTSLDDTSEVFETQDLVVGTKTMPKEDWVKTRVFSWMVSLLHFDKLLHIPFILLNKNYQLSYRELAEIFIKESKKYPQISEILSFFMKKAEDVQKGDCEYIPSKEWLNIWWPADEYMLIKLIFEGKLEAFYKEAESSLYDFLKGKNIEIPTKLLSNAIKLNKYLIKLPFVDEDLNISLDYNIFEFYQGVLNELDISVEAGDFKYTIDRTSNKWMAFDEWLKEVVWYGSKRGAYLYDCKRIAQESLTQVAYQKTG